MQNEKHIIRKVNSAIAFAEGFLEELKMFKQEITKGEEPKRRNRMREIEEKSIRAYQSSLTKK